MPAAGYWLWKVDRLKAELSRRGAVSTGRKLDLVERLEAYDRNSNFQNDPIPMPEPLSVNWPVSGFRQISKEHKLIMPKITREQIDAYFLYRLAGDRQCNGDIKAMVKGGDMFQSSRVWACSVNIVQDDMYFSGIVGAAYKKKSSYNYKVKIHRQTGDPLNTHCECPSGRGPHGTCKHLAAVMIMLETFVNTGELNVEKSCTESLQTFHKPKADYSGSPVKAEDMSRKRKTTEEFLADPRPEKYRNDKGSSDRVRNLVINYCSLTSKDLSMRYLYPKAHIQALVHDHSYYSRPLSEYWIDEGNKINERQAIQLERNTRGQSTNSAWFDQRSWRLTASRFGDICKATCRRNTTKLCESLSGSYFVTNATLHGKNYEKKALQKFEKTQNVNTSKCGLFVRDDLPFLGASPDAVVGEDAVVEIKCPYSGKNENIKPGKHFQFLAYDKNENIILKRSSKYYDQVQGQMFLSKRKYCYFVVYTFCDLFVQKLSLDDDYCSSCLVPKLTLFYEKYYKPYLASKL